MALIDKQTLIDSFCSQCTVDKPETCSTIRYGDKWCNEVYTILNAPTVDAAPVRHGHWVRWYEEVYDSFGVAYVPHCKCSECGMEYDPYIANRTNYCSNCGVKLDGKDGDHAEGTVQKERT